MCNVESSKKVWVIIFPFILSHFYMLLYSLIGCPIGTYNLKMLVNWTYFRIKTLINETSI